MNKEIDKREIEIEMDKQLKKTYINGIMVGFKTGMEMIKSYCDTHNNEDVKKFVEKNLTNKNLKVMKEVIEKKKR